MEKEIDENVDQLSQIKIQVRIRESRKILNTKKVLGLRMLWNAKKSRRQSHSLHRRNPLNPQRSYSKGRFRRKENMEEKNHGKIKPC